MRGEESRPRVLHRCSVASFAIVSARTSGASPGSTRMSSSASRSSNTVSATLTASPVPRCTRCSTNSTGTSVTSCSCSVLVTCSAPWPTTTTMRSSGSSASASTTWSTIGRPHSGCSTLGVPRAHPRAFAGGEHDGGERSVLAHRLVSDSCSAPPALARGRGFEPRLRTPKDLVLPLHHPRILTTIAAAPARDGRSRSRLLVASPLAMGSLIKKRRKRMRKKKHKKLLKKTRWQRRQQGK